MPIDLGTRFDRYQILAPLGEGGMGQVYLAQDTKLGRKVALKLLPEKYTRDSKRLRRFEQEARAASALNHPNIITIHEIGEVEGVHFIATEFIEGQTLRQLLSKERLSIRQALDTTIQVASALVAAHAAGIVHRDIKPENVMLRPDGYVKVLDFGLAKLIEQAAQTNAVDAGADTDENKGIPTSENIVNEATVDSDAVSRETIHQATVNQETVKPLADSFGLTQMDSVAPLSEDGNETAAVAVSGHTTPGLVMGTLHYLSPEQARGLRVDTRTDIFSLGVVLYEMLTGRRPFTGQARKDIMAAILTAEPLPIARSRPDTPDLLEWIAAKALIKEREERYQTAREMLNDLKRLQQRLDVEAQLALDRRGLTESELADSEAHRSSGSQAIAAFNSGHSGNSSPSGSLTRLADSGGAPAVNFTPSPRDPRRGLTILAASSIAALTMLSAYLIYNSVISRKSQPIPFQQMKVTRFTASGKALRAALSPDGKFVVYALGDTRRQRLVVQQVERGVMAEVVPVAEAVYRGLTFSPDSQLIYYVVQEGANPIQSLYQVTVLGGAPRKLLDDIDSGVSFAPDGKRLAYVRRVLSAREDLLIVADANGGAAHTLAIRKGEESFITSGVAWSPDGKTIVCPAGSNAGGRRVFYVAVDAASGAMKKLGDLNWTNAGRPVWLPNGRGLLVSGTEKGTTQAQLWQISYPSGAVQRLSNDLNDYRDLSLSADGRSLIAVQTEAQVNVWVTPNGGDGQARQLTSGVGQYNGVRGLAWTPEGRIVFVSRQSGSQDIWIMNSDGTGRRQLTTPETRADVNPAITPDGKSIVFVSTRTGNSNIYRMAIDGTGWQQLTSGAGEEFPTVTSDNQAVIYTATNSSLFTLWRVPLAGGTPVQLTDHLSQWPVTSPDGKWIACWYRAEAKQPWRVALLPTAGGPPTQLLNLVATADSALPVRWMPDSQAIAFINVRDGVSNIWSYALAGGALRQLTAFTDNEQLSGFDISRDGKWVVCSRGTVINDVLLFSLPKE